MANPSPRQDPHRNSTHQTRVWGVLVLFVDPIREGFPSLEGEGGWQNCENPHAAATAAARDLARPSPLPPAPRSNISRSGKPLTPTWKIWAFLVFCDLYVLLCFGLEPFFHDVPGPSGINSGLINSQNGGMRVRLYQFLCF